MTSSCDISILRQLLLSTFVLLQCTYFNHRAVAAAVAFLLNRFDAISLNLSSEGLISAAQHVGSQTIQERFDTRARNESRLQFHTAEISFTLFRVRKALSCHVALDPHSGSPITFRSNVLPRINATTNRGSKFTSLSSNPHQNLHYTALNYNF